MEVKEIEKVLISADDIVGDSERLVENIGIVDKNEESPTKCGVSAS